MPGLLFKEIRYLYFSWVVRIVLWLIIDSPHSKLFHRLVSILNFLICLFLMFLFCLSIMLVLLAWGEQRCKMFCSPELSNSNIGSQGKHIVQMWEWITMCIVSLSFFLSSSLSLSLSLSLSPSLPLALSHPTL